jgi:hypothetical protein
MMVLMRRCCKTLEWTQKVLLLSFAVSHLGGRMFV